MNIDDLTYGQLKKIAEIFNNKPQQCQKQDLQTMVGSKCIIRTESAGVWFGVVEQKAGREVIVKDARRLWQWKAAKGISLSAVAIHGVDSSECRFANMVPFVWLEAIELIPASADAIKSIEGTKDAEAR